MATKSSKASSLLALIQTAPTEPSEVAPTGPPSPQASSRRAAPQSRKAARREPKVTQAEVTGRTGSRVTIFLHEGDRRIIQELMAYLAGQGRRVSESIVIKAALRTANPGQALLNAHEEAARQDQRFKEHGST